MTLEISTIRNEYLREAAEAADSKGSNAYNNKLDANELTVFMQNAIKSGKCSKLDVLTVVEQVGIDENDNQTVDKINQLDQIDKLKDEIRDLKTELGKRKFTLRQKEPQPTTIASLSMVGGLFGGVWAGIRVGAAISAGISTTGVGAIATPAIMIVSTLGGAALGGYAAYKAADYAQRPFESHQRTVHRKDAENYKQNNVEPLKAEIKAKEKELEEKLAKFYQ